MRRLDGSVAFAERKRDSPGCASSTDRSEEQRLNRWIQARRRRTPAWQPRECGKDAFVFRSKSATRSRRVVVSPDSRRRSSHSARDSLRQRRIARLDARPHPSNSLGSTRLVVVALPRTCPLCAQRKTKMLLYQDVQWHYTGEPRTGASSG